MTYEQVKKLKPEDFKRLFWRKEAFPEQWDFIQKEIRSDLLFELLQVLSESESNILEVDTLLENARYVSAQ